MVSSKRWNPSEQNNQWRGQIEKQTIKKQSNQKNGTLLVRNGQFASFLEFERARKAIQEAIVSNDLKRPLEFYSMLKRSQFYLNQGHLARLSAP